MNKLSNIVIISFLAASSKASILTLTPGQTNNRIFGVVVDTGGPGQGSHVVTNQNYGEFDDSTGFSDSSSGRSGSASAQMTSNIQFSSNALSITGHASTNSAWNAPTQDIYVNSSSTISFHFTISGAEPFQFSLSASTAPSTQDDPAYQNYVQLSGPSGSFIVGNTVTSEYPVTGNFTGLLAPGNYFFYAITSESIQGHPPFRAASGSYSGQYDVTFSVTPAPEPSSALLLLSGVAFCLRRRTLRTNERNA